MEKVPRALAWPLLSWLPPGFPQVLERACGAACPAVSRTPLVFFSVSFSLESLISLSRPLSVATPAPAPCPSPTTASLGCAPPTDHQLAEEETGQLSRVQAPPRCQKRAEGREGETESAHCPRRLTVSPRVLLLSWESPGPEPGLAGLPHLAAQATAPMTPRREGPTQDPLTSDPPLSVTPIPIQAEDKPPVGGGVPVLTRSAGLGGSRTGRVRSPRAPAPWLPAQPRAGGGHSGGIFSTHCCSANTADPQAQTVRLDCCQISE